jgi:hypothetical protein
MGCSGGEAAVAVEAAFVRRAATPTEYLCADAQALRGRDSANRSRVTRARGTTVAPLRSMKAMLFHPVVICASLALAGCTSLFMRSEPSEADLKSAAILKSCPLGVPSTRVRIADTGAGVDLFFTTSMSGVDDLRRRVRDQAKANGPNRHLGAGHDGHHDGYHDHGLQLWSMGQLSTNVEDTPSGARLGIVPLDPKRRDEIRKLVIERVAYLEAQGCHD